MANVDEMNLALYLSATIQSNGSSSADCQLASFLLGRLETGRLRSGATLPTSNTKCHLRKNLSLKKMGMSLGKGTSASVLKAEWCGVEVAKKTFHGPKNGDFLREVSILEGLSHPNIVSLLWYMADEKRCHLVMELMDGDLHSLMQERMEENGDQRPPFCIPEALDVILQLGEGMRFLHEKRIVHRDLKSHNILFQCGPATKADMKYLRVKVSDFGLSKTKEHSAYASTTLNVGTTRWMAPEVMKIANDDDQARKVELKYPFKSDVYSFAMVCYEILTGDVPFSALSLSEVKSLVLRGGRPQLPRECPERLRTLIEACWSAEAVTRPSFGDICEELRIMKYENLLTYWVGVNSPLSRDDIAAISEFAAKERVKVSQCSPEDKAAIDELIAKLSSPVAEVQRSAAYDIRLRAKKNLDHQIYIAEQGAIPLLVVLLLSPDQKTQEHAVTALLNLSINDSNKWRIVAAGAIEPVVEVLRSGCMEARENAAATLFSLSLVDENKITIGNSGAIPALVQLLDDGTARGKKDAATALFNLSIYQGNKARVVQAGVVPPLMSLIAEQPATMLDEALAILAILATHHEGRIAIGEVGPTPIWVRIIVSESARNKENAAAILLALCSHDSGYIKQARESNAVEPLTVLAHSRESTNRAKRKALALLELLKKLETYLQSLTVRLDEMRVKRRDTEQWMRHCNLPHDIVQRVRRYDQDKWLATGGVDEEMLVQSLPSDLRRDIKRHLCLRLFPFCDQMDDSLLDAMCESLRPALCTEGTHILHEGDPVNEMFFIIRGELESMTTNGGRTGFFNKAILGSGDFCGDELLTWALNPKPQSHLPVSTHSVKAVKEVEAFSLSSDDLKFVTSQFRRLHSKQLQHTFRYYSNDWRTWGACFIQAAWRRHQRRLAELRRKAPDNLSLGATILAVLFATNAMRSVQRLRSMHAAEHTRISNIPKPSEPDFSEGI